MQIHLIAFTKVNVGLMIVDDYDELIQ